MNTSININFPPSNLAKYDDPPTQAHFDDPPWCAYPKPLIFFLFFYFLLSQFWLSRLLLIHSRVLCVYIYMYVFACLEWNICAVPVVVALAGKPGIHYCDTLFHLTVSLCKTFSPLICIYKTYIDSISTQVFFALFLHTDMNEISMLMEE